MAVMIAATDALKKAGIRLTVPRIRIFSVLQKASYPMSIEDVKKHKDAKEIDTVTVYRTLEAFKRNGLVVQIDFRLGRALYEFVEEKRDHHHIVCTSCSKVEDFTGCEYQPLAKHALKQSKDFARITSHSLEFFGLCTPCATK